MGFFLFVCFRKKNLLRDIQLRTMHHYGKGQQILELLIQIILVGQVPWASEASAGNDSTSDPGQLMFLGSREWWLRTWDP